MQMILLGVSVLIALSVVVIGMLVIAKGSAHVNMDRLQVFIALASGFMLAVLFLELLPRQMNRIPEGGAEVFFVWVLAGMILVITFERYLVSRLWFVEKFFHGSLKSIDTHDETFHEGHHHHDHGTLEDAAHCDDSHQHAHLHQHTHLAVVGQGEVCSAIACFMICSFFDGVALASVQAVDQTVGLALVMGIILHLLPEGIISGAMALAGGATAKAAQKVLLFIGGAFVAGAAVPQLLTAYHDTLLAISVGIMIFVTLVQLLPTALKLRFAPLWISLGIVLFIGVHAMLVLIQPGHVHG